MKSHGLEKELDEVKASLLKEIDKHDTLHVVIQLVFDDLKLAQKVEVSSYAVRAIRITDRAREIAREALRFGVKRSFVTTHSHNENIDQGGATDGVRPPTVRDDAWYIAR